MNQNLKKSQVHTNTAFQGELYIFSEAILWSLFPIFSILIFSSIPPLYTAAISTLISALFFGIVLTIKKKWHELNNKSAWKDMLLTTLFIGIIFYTLIFYGLQKTTAGNASIILLIEVLFSIAILGLWKKEKLTKKRLSGSILMIIGAFVVLFQGSLQINQGDIILLIATAIPPIGNYYAQNARKKVSSTTIMFFRSIIAGCFLLMIATFLEKVPNGSNISDSIIFFLINGIILLGISKILWLEGIHRIPITKAISLASVGPAFTLFFAFLILGEIPTIWQITGLIPIIFGISLLTNYKFWNNKKRTTY